MWKKILHDLLNGINERRKIHEYDKADFERVIGKVIANKAVQRMKKFNHHSHTSCFRHSMHVSYFNYKICKRLGLDAESGAKAGMLHDLFLYDWHKKEIRLDSLHGFEHPYIALKNAKKNFKLNKVEEDIIEKHMFPLTPRFPKYKETVVIILTDKFCSVCEVMDRFFKKAA